jgi:endonuclease-8
VPEGDTIHRAAATLGAALEGRELTGFEAPAFPRGRHPREGERIDRVWARGKHLLIEFDGGLTLHTHLRMTGSWHLLGNERGRRRSRRTQVVTVRAGEVEAACFSAPIVELLGADELRRHPVLSLLGPDLCLADADLDEVLRRLERLDPSTEIGVALLDQTVAAGVGNVYRSEVAWACLVDPCRPLRSVDLATRRNLYSTAGRLLRMNLTTTRRTTYRGGLAVYGLAGRACPRCSDTIAHRRLGEHARSVWWCPGCQR